MMLQDSQGNNLKLDVNVNQGAWLKYDAAGRQVFKVTGKEGAGAAERYVYNQRGEFVRADVLIAKLNGSTNQQLADINWRDASVREAMYDGSYVDPRGNAIADDKLWTISIENEYDIAGRIQTQRGYFNYDEGRQIGSHWVDVGGLMRSEQKTFYDKDGRNAKTEQWGIASHYWSGFNQADGHVGEIYLQLNQARMQGNKHLGLIAVTRYDAYVEDGKTISAYDAAGNLHHYQYDKKLEGDGESEPNGILPYTNTFKYEYKRFDRYVNVLIEGSSSEPTKRTGTTNLFLNKSGDLVQVVQSHAHEALTKDQHQFFQLDVEGRVLQKEHKTYDKEINAFEEDITNGGRTWRHYYSNQQSLAQISGIGGIQLTQARSYEVMSAQTNLSDRQYLVQTGDTLRSIARMHYGSESLWYVIAEANGLADTSALTQGQSLLIPAVTNSTNQAGDFKTYNPSEIIGDVTPSVPYVPNAFDPQCELVTQIITVAITVAATIATQNHTAGAAIGSWVGQFVGKQLGTYPEMDMDAVLVATATASVSDFLGPHLEFSAATNAAISSMAKYAVNYGVRNALGHEDASFSAREMLASGASAYIEAEYAPAIQDHVFGENSGVTASSFSWSGVGINFFANTVSEGIHYGMQKAFGNNDASWNNRGLISSTIGSSIGTVVGTEIRRQKDWDKAYAKYREDFWDRMFAKPQETTPTLGLDWDRDVSGSEASAPGTAAFALVGLPLSMINAALEKARQKAEGKSIKGVPFYLSNQLTRDDYAYALDKIAFEGRRTDWSMVEDINDFLTPGNFLLDNESIHYLAGGLYGGVREGLQFEFTESVRARANAANQINPGEAGLVMLFQEGLSPYDKLLLSISAAGGYASDASMDNLLAQINSGSNEIDLTYVRAESDAYFDHLRSTDSARSEGWSNLFMNSRTTGNTVNDYFQRYDNIMRADDALLPLGLDFSGAVGTDRAFSRAMNLAFMVAGVAELPALGVTLLGSLAGRGASRVIDDGSVSNRTLPMSSSSEFLGQVDNAFIGLPQSEKINLAFKKIEHVFGSDYANKTREVFDSARKSSVTQSSDLGFFRASGKKPLISLNDDIGNVDVYALTILHETRHLRQFNKLRDSLLPANKALTDADYRRAYNQAKVHWDDYRTHIEKEIFATSTNIWQGQRLGLSSDDLKIFINYYNDFRN